MAFYRVYGLVIESTVTMPELTEAINDVPDYRFYITRSLNEAAPGYAWFLRLFQDDGEICFLCGKRGKSFLLRYPGLADFEINDEDKDILCRAQPGTSYCPPVSNSTNSCQPCSTARS